MTRNKKSTILLIVSTVLMAISMAVSAVFAFFVAKQSGWTQNISSITTLFYLNDKKIYDVTNYDLELLSKGDAVDLNLDVQLISYSVQSGVGKYDIEIDYMNADDDNELARAVEVYKYENGEYEYVSMLDSFKSIIGESPIRSIGSSEKTQLRYKLVYSKAAGTYYDNKSFGLHFSATSTLISSSENNVYVINSKQFISAVSDIQNTDKLIVLNNNITIDSDLSILAKVGIDCNGHSIKFENGSKLIFAYSTEGNDIFSGIKNSGVSESVVGDGSIEIRTSNDAPYIQDDLTNKFIISAVSEDVLCNRIQNTIDSNKKYLVSGDRVYVLEGYKKYFDSKESFVLNDSESILSAKDNNFYISNIQEDQTTIKNFSAKIGSNQVDFNLTIRGNNDESIASSYLDSVPSLITGNIFLPSYDQATNASMTWISDKEDLLNSNGQYLSGDVESLDDWNRSPCNLTCLITLNGIQSLHEKLVYIEIADAKQRTEKIYDFSQIVINENNSPYSVYATNINKELSGSQKANLSKIKISFANETDNVSENGNIYLSIDDSSENDLIILENAPGAGNSVLVNIVIDFVYIDGLNEIDYQITKQVTVLGTQPTSQIIDMGNELQRGFEENNYVNGKGYKFDVSGYASQNGMNIEYTVYPAYEAYILVENDKIKSDENGKFVLLNGNYVFIKNRYSKTDSDYVDDLNGAYALIDGNYIDISSLERYTKYSTVYVFPDRVPHVAETLAHLSAKIWSSESKNGTKNYITDENGEVINYDVTLVIKGIYHNIPSEIKDYKVYKRLLQLFDGVNGDAPNGYIEYSEANASWDKVVAYCSQNLRSFNQYGVSEKYISFESSSISSLKGIEYFTNIQGISFKSNKIMSIEELSSLRKLVYLNLGQNWIADLKPLEFLDSLEIVYLNNNLITDITPIKYLTKIVSLEIQQNNSISDFSSLMNYSNLSYLDITQTGGISGSDHSKFVCTLIKANNPNCTVKNEGSAFVVEDYKKVAALALSKLVMASEIFDTLFIPYEYLYNGTTYKLYYTTQTASNLKFINYESNGVPLYTIGYEVDESCVDSAVEITVHVMTDDSGDSSRQYSLSNKFELTLKSGVVYTSNAYIETSKGVYQNVVDLVPDIKLRALLYQYFNSNTSSTVLKGDATEKNTITISELESRKNNSGSDNAFDFDFSSQGISDLTGLRYFASGFYHNRLNLCKNSFKGNDISELSFLTNLQILSLSGQEFDFNQLCANSDLNSTGITSLTRLDIYGCYNLTDETVLEGLYNVYMTNPKIVIYKDSSTIAWNPYENSLKILYRSIRSKVSLSNLNDQCSFFSGDDNCFTTKIYGKLLNVYIIDCGANGYLKDCVSYVKTTESMNVINESNSLVQKEKEIVTGLKLVNLAPYSDEVFKKFSLYACDGIRNINFNGDGYYYIDVMLNFSSNIYVVDYDTPYTLLTKLFDGKALRTFVVNKLTNLFVNNSSVSLSNANLIGKAENTQTIAQEIGDGYYFDENANKYYISLQTLWNLNKDDSYELQSDGTIVSNGSNANRNLNLINIKKLYAYQDIKIIDGSELSNLESLRITNAVVNLSSINYTLSNLTSLLLGRDITSSSDDTYYNKLIDFGNCFEFMPNIVNVQILNCHVYNWEALTGLEGKDVETLKIYATNNSHYSNDNATTEATVDIITNIYTRSNATNKKFYIGSKTIKVDNTTMFDDSWGSEDYPDTLVLNATKQYKEFYSDIIDLGFMYNGTLSYLSTNTTISSGQSIFLPKDTSSYDNVIYSGADDYQHNTFAIDWKVFGLDNSNNFANLFNIEGNYNITYSTTILNLKSFNLNVQSDLTMVASGLMYDYYLIFEGTIGNSYYSNDGVKHSFSESCTKTSFIYPVLIKGNSDAGDNYALMREFTDPNTRLLSYLSLCYANAINTDGRIKLNSSAGSGNAADITSIKILGYDSTSYADIRINSSSKYTFKSYGFSNYYNYIYKAIYNLDGFNKVFTNLSTLLLGSTDICDITGISDMDSLTRLQIEGSIAEKEYTRDGNNSSMNVQKGSSLSNASPIGTLKNLQVVDLRFNTINNFIGDDGYSIFNASANSLQTINVNGNFYFDENALMKMVKSSYSTQAEKDKVNTYPNLTDLLMNNSNSCMNLEAYRYIRQIMLEANRTGSSSIYLAIYGGDERSISYSTLDNFINDCDKGGCVYEYLTGNSIVKPSGYTITYYNTSDTNNNNYLHGLTRVVYVATSSMKVVLDYAKITSIDSTNTKLYLSSTDSNYYEYVNNQFDPVVWAKITKNSSIVNGKAVYKATNKFVISGNSTDIFTLKGVNLLPGLKYIAISGTDYKLKSLWADGQVFDSLQSLEIRSRAITEQALAVIADAPNLSILKVEDICRSIDLEKPIDYTSSAGVHYTTLAQIILSLPNLTTVLINSSNNYHYFLKSSDVDRGYITILNNIYNNTADYVDGEQRPISKLLDKKGLYINLTSRAITNGSSVFQYSINDTYNQSDYFGRPYIGLNSYYYRTSSIYSKIIKSGQHGTSTIDSNNLSLTVSQYSLYEKYNISNYLNFSSSLSDNQRPIYEDSVDLSDVQREGGVVFELPVNILLEGNDNIVTWSCNIANALVDDTLVITSDILGGKTSIVVTATVMGQQYSHTFKVYNNNFASEDGDDIRRPNYYVEMESGSYTNAYDVFDSLELVYYLFQEQTSFAVASSASISGFPTNLSAGYVLTKNTIDQVKVIDLPTFAPSDADYDYANRISIKGIEIFKNLTNIIIHRGWVPSLEPLRDLNNLTMVYLSLSAFPDNLDGYVSQPIDYSPLYNKKNLQTLYIGYGSSYAMADISWALNLDLSSLSNLAFYSNNISPYNSYYPNSSSFAYTINKLKQKKSSLTIGYLSTKQYQLNDEYDQVIEEFDLINYDGLNVSKQDNLLTINSYETIGNTRKIQLQSIIKIGVSKAIGIEYYSLSSYIHDIKITFEGKEDVDYSFKYILDDNTEVINLKNGDDISFNTLQKILLSVEYQRLAATGEISFNTTALIDEGYLDSERALQLDVRIFVNDLAYDTIQYLQFA